MSKMTAGAPACAAVAVLGKADVTPWAFTAANPQAPQLSSKPEAHSSVLWRADDAIDAAVEINDGKEHQVALFMPFGLKSQIVDVIDADNNTVLDTQKFDEKGPGYLRWNVKGSVLIRVSSTQMDENHAIVIGGVLFDSMEAVAK